MEKNKVQEFLNESFGEVRVTTIDNELWFVAKDVSKILEYRDGNDLCRGLDDDEKDTQTLCTLGGNQEMLIINESGLYNAVLSITRRNPIRYEKAKDFKKWITKTVIPAIRKDGAYINGEEKLRNKEISEDEFILQAMTILQTKVERYKKENDDLKEENNKMKPIVSLVDKFTNINQSYDVGTFSKIIYSKENNLGRNRLFDWLRKKKILMSNNTPYQNYIDYFNVIAVENEYNGKINYKTMIKPNGITYIYKRLVNDGRVIDKPIEQVIEELGQAS